MNFMSGKCFVDTSVLVYVHDLSAGTLDGLDMWAMFHTEGFNPEEVHFHFEFPTE